MRNFTKLIKLFAAAVISIILLTSCSGDTGASKIDPELRKEAEAYVMDSIQKAVTLLGSDTKDYSKKTYPYEKQSSYANLPQSRKALYDEIYEKVKNFEYFIYTADEDGYDVLDSVLDVSGRITDEHKEIVCFGTNEILTDDGITTGIESIYFQPYDSSMTPVQEADMDKLKHTCQVFEASCDIIVENMPKNISAYDKYRYLAYVISYLNKYDHENLGGMMTGNAYGPINGGYSICQGYAYAMEYLCQKADLWCRVAEGESHGWAHAWNLVKLEDGTYHVDITWSDDGPVTGSPEWMKWFMLTEEQISEDHIVYYGYEATGTVEYN